MRKYVVGSGWYTTCEKGYTRKKAGCPFSRSTDFVKLWQQTLFKYANPAAVVITDSASPVAYVPHPDIEVIRLDQNYQHCGNYFTGWMKGFLNSAVYAWMCDADYIYVEQDCLVLGDWVERIYRIAEETEYQKFIAGNVVYGGLNRCRQPIQVSLLYVPYEKIMDLVHGVVSPDNKAPWKDTPEGHRPIDEPLLTNSGVEWTHLDFGYGRLRPITWKDEVLFVQHWTEDDFKQLEIREN